MNDWVISHNNTGERSLFKLKFTQLFKKFAYTRQIVRISIIIIGVVFHDA